MNIGVVACSSAMPLFAVFGIIFALLEGRVAILISGFNTLFGKERVQYDAVAMAKDMRNSCYLWAAIIRRARRSLEVQVHKLVQIVDRGRDNAPGSGVWPTLSTPTTALSGHRV